MSMSLVASAAPPGRPLFANESHRPLFKADLGHLMAESSSKPNEPPTDIPTVLPATGGSSSSTHFAQPSNPPKRTSSRRSEPSHEPSPRPSKRPRPDPAPLTAAAALQDKQRAEKPPTHPAETSVNPATRVLSDLMGVDVGGTSALQDTPPGPANTMSEPLHIVAENILEKTDETHGEGPAQTSPVSLSSIGTLESNIALSVIETATIDSPRSGDEPGPEMEETPEKATKGRSLIDEGPKSFSYPGPPAPAQMPPNRGMSLSGSELQTERPSLKKHRCPYCETDFTRHHNLKSHLLTHSQEKPYVCQTCQSRFRRLHDLKRHTKLHTGEKPHICPRCGRKFARGDALARHNKGPGGCAGRRSSTGSFGADEDYDGTNEEAMEGLVYDEPENMDDEEAAGPRNIPSIRRHAPAREPAAERASIQPRQPSTYPPIQGRPLGGLAAASFAPPAAPSGSGPSARKLLQGLGTTYPAVSASSSSTLYPAATASSIFPPGSMTESPKPLSPGAPHGSHPEGPMYPDRSSNVISPFRQQYGRGSGRRTPPPSSAGASLSASSQLPPPHPSSLNPPDSRYTLPSQGPAHPPTGPTGPPTHMSGGGLSSHSNSLSSHGQSAKGSGDNSAAMFGPREDRLWAYVKGLEDRINGLQGEVASLKDQLTAATQSNPPR